jgi:hypothetical protein
VFFKAEPIGFNANFLKHTKALTSTLIHTGHYLQIPLKNSDVTHVFTNFPLHIWLVYATCALCLVLFFAVKLSYRGVPSTQIPYDLIILFGLFVRQSPHVNCRTTRIAPKLTVNTLITVFVLNFVFETLIKTDKVVQDTSSVINSVDDALRSTRILGWGVEERVNLEFSQALPGSWQNRIWSRKKMWVKKTMRGMRDILFMATKLLAIQDIMYLYVSHSLFCKGRSINRKSCFRKHEK